MVKKIVEVVEKIVVVVIELVADVKNKDAFGNS